MEILLDTHIILWLLTDDSRLSKEAREIVLNPKHKVYYSIVSMWEVGIKYAIGKSMPLSASQFMHYCEASGFEQLTLESRHVCAYETLQRIESAVEHKDPFDKMLLAQAKADCMLLITHDSKFSGWNEPYVKIV